jgi:hypothetical protein
MGKLKSKLSVFLKKVWAAIEKAWDKLNDEAKVLVPIAIQVTNAIKEVVKEGSFTGSLIDVILAKIKLPGDLDEKALVLIRKWVPILLTKLVIVKNISEITDPEDQLKAIIDEIRIFNDDQKELFWDGFSKKFIEYAGDGKITKSEIACLVKWYYENKAV